jgi:hypothetical protein
MQLYGEQLNGFRCRQEQSPICFDPSEDFHVMPQGFVYVLAQQQFHQNWRHRETDTRALMWNSRRSAYWPKRSDTITRHSSLPKRIGSNHFAIVGYSFSFSSEGGAVAGMCHLYQRLKSTPGPWPSASCDKFSTANNIGGRHSIFEAGSNAADSSERRLFT